MVSALDQARICKAWKTVKGLSPANTRIARGLLWTLEVTLDAFHQNQRHTLEVMMSGRD